MLCDELESSTIYLNKTIDVVVAEPSSEDTSAEESEDIDAQSSTNGEGEIAVASIEEDESTENPTNETMEDSTESESVTKSATATEEANKATNVDGMSVVTFSRKKAKAAQSASSS